MSDRFNTIAGWTLFSGIVLLGLSAVSSRYFHAGKEQRPEKMGYEIAGVVQEGEGGADATPFEAFLAKADMAKGEKTFAKCASCHTIDQGGANGLGPNLYAVMGEGMGQGRGGFAFSEALKGKGGKWDWASMNAWLTSPSAFAPGTKMSFAGLSDPQERANLIVYLNSKGSNLPLPAVPEAPAAGAAPEAAAVVGDAAKGQKSFAKCAACHNATPGGPNGIGPNLAGVMGEGVAQGRGGYAFSDALKAKGGKWDEATMDAWLTDPAKFAPGTKMSFAGLSDAQERANIIAYLKSVK
ncbi:MULTISPECIES: c-type cytochrome [unclassified Novosphingobium]|uniref:c-type cytochrome n=1 Tax=unclassified Novosphingobium TaxID=2644732 RepID=UPI000EE46FD2|nr:MULTISPECIES: c-type cytochrome [unclassified Novosphingobium]HCF25020.1 cytochrome c family protein [Novosphingobium sp.]HQV01929.1 c-type cytochrome [Novosphingobium sp.]